MIGRQKSASDEEIDLRGLKDMRREIHGVNDQKNAILVFVHLGQLADGHAVLDGQRVELEGLFENRFRLLGVGASRSTQVCTSSSARKSRSRSCVTFCSINFPFLKTKDRIMPRLQNRGPIYALRETTASAV